MSKKPRLTPCSTWLQPIKDNNKALKPKKEAIIVDLDGTVAFSTNRGWYEEEKCATDEPNLPVIRVIQHFIKYDTEVAVLFVSGRKDIAREQSRSWIFKHIYNEGDFGHHIKDIKLYMRKSDDVRDDAIVKEEIYFEHILPQYCVIGVWDDRPKVVRNCWRKNKLFVFNCYQDDIDF